MKSIANPLGKLMLSGAVICAPAFASFISTVSTTAVTSTCSGSGGTTASCTSTGQGGAYGPVTAKAKAYLDREGKLVASAYANGPETSASAAITFSGQLIVTGVSGSGSIDAMFSGFQDMTGGNGSPDRGTVNPLSITIGSSSTSVALPSVNLSPADWAFTVSAPVNFGVPIPFSYSISDSGTGGHFHNGTYIRQSPLAVLSQPKFSVRNASGALLSNAAVQYVPEPGTLGLLGCAALFLLWLRFRKERAV